jgi:hypothetical protein
MEDIIQKIMEALQSGDFETAESLVQQAESMDGGGDNAMVKMARGACGAYAAKGGDAANDDAAVPPKQPPMAASRDLGRFAGDTAFSRAMANLDAATKRADRSAVVALIATSRECFDAADEREHLANPDPAATERHIKSIKRKLTTGTLAASRAVPKPGAKEPEPAKTEDATFGLDAFEMEAATKNKISFRDYAEAKKHTRLAGAKGSN